MYLFFYISISLGLHLFLKVYSCFHILCLGFYSFFFLLFFWGEWTVGLMPLFRCIYLFFYISFSLGLCIFLKVYFCFHILWVSIFFSGGWGWA